MNLGCDQWTTRAVGRNNSSYYCDYQRVELTYVCWVQLRSEGRGCPLVSMPPLPCCHWRGTGQGSPSSHIYLEEPGTLSALRPRTLLGPGAAFQVLAPQQLPLHLAESRKWNPRLGRRKLRTAQFTPQKIPKRLSNRCHISLEMVLRC